MRNLSCTRLMIRLVYILVAIAVLDVSFYSGSIYTSWIDISMTEHASGQSEDSSRNLQNVDIEQDEECIPVSTSDVVSVEISLNPTFRINQSDVRESIRHEGEPPENS